MSKKTKIWAMILAVTLAALMLLSVAIPLVVGNAASKLDTKKSDLNVIKENKKRLEAQIKDIKNNKLSAIQHKTALDEHIQLSEEEIDGINELIQEYTVQISNTQLQYENALSIEAEKEALFLERLCAMEETGKASYISVLMRSTSFADLLGRMSVISEIAENDLKIMDDLRVAREEIAVARYKLETEKEEQTASRRQLVEAQADLVRQYEELDSMIAELEAEQQEYQKAYDEAQSEEDKLNAEIKKIMDELARSNSAYIGGNMLWPLPGYSRISSPFGSRTHPILKVKKNHTGIDIPAPTGTKIVAANDGTVILATYNGGYGNCVTIDHGGGIATLYGHASKLLVKKGQKVKRGETIALVGSTGLSTGPHLHFETIKNGVKYNPVTFKP